MKFLTSLTAYICDAVIKWQFAVSSYAQRLFAIGTFYRRFFYLRRNCSTWGEEKMIFRCICLKIVTLKPVEKFSYCTFNFVDYLIITFTTFIRSCMISKLVNSESYTQTKISHIHLCRKGENLIWNLGVHHTKYLTNH